MAGTQDIAMAPARKTALVRNRSVRIHLSPAGREDGCDHTTRQEPKVRLTLSAGEDWIRTSVNLIVAPFANRVFRLLDATSRLDGASPGYPHFSHGHRCQYPRY
jgi:hypothetical protein